MAGDAEEWAAFVASSRAWAAARGGGDMTRLWEDLAILRAAAARHDDDDDNHDNDDVAPRGRSRSPLPSPSSKPKGPPPGTPEPLVSKAKAMLVTPARKNKCLVRPLRDPWTGDDGFDHVFVGSGGTSSSSRAKPKGPPPGTPATGGLVTDIIAAAHSVAQHDHAAALIVPKTESKAIKGLAAALIVSKAKLKVGPASSPDEDSVGSATVTTSTTLLYDPADLDRLRQEHLRNVARTEAVFRTYQVHLHLPQDTDTAEPAALPSSADSPATAQESAPGANGALDHSFAGMD